MNAESQVTTLRMARLIATVRERDIPTIYCESTVSDKAQGRWPPLLGPALAAVSMLIRSRRTDPPPLLDLQRHNVALIRRGLLEVQR